MARFYKYVFYVMMLFGDSVIKVRFFGLYFSDILVLISIIYIIKERDNWNDSNELTNVFSSKLLYYYVIWIFSFLGVYQLFNIPIEFDRGYFLIRQSYYLFYIPALLLALIISFKNLNLLSILKQDSKYLLTICIILNNINYYFGNTFSLQLLICLFSAIELTKRKNLFQFIVILNLIYLTLHFLQKGDSAYFLIFSCILTFNYIDLKAFITFFNKQSNWKLALFFLIPFLVLFSNKESFLGVDTNVLFRVLIWENEFKYIFETYFLGVGYGTTYFDHTLYELAYIVIGGVNTGLEAPFMIPSHNSFLTILYRTGLIGLALFFYFLKSFLFIGIDNKKNFLTLSIFISIVIMMFFHPLIEVARGIIAFIFSLFVLLKVKEDSVYELSKGN